MWRPAAGGAGCKGTGYGMLQDASAFNRVVIWAPAALLTGVFVLYDIARFSPWVAPNG